MSTKTAFEFLAIIDCSGWITTCQLSNRNNNKFELKQTV